MLVTCLSRHALYLPVFRPSVLRARTSTCLCVGAPVYACDERMHVFDDVVRNIEILTESG
jgi:hypothetical protein